MFWYQEKYRSEKKQANAHKKNLYFDFIAEPVRLLYNPGVDT